MSLWWLAARRPAAVDHDRDRRAVGAKLYGQGAPEIIYAALSFDGRGLNSYGPVSLTLRELTIEHRSTVLDENSYQLGRRPGVSIVGALPQGHLSVWTDRQELVIGKLAPALDPAMSTAALDALLMHSEGNRQTDEFFEVHIWGGFDHRAIGSVHVAAQPAQYEGAQESAIVDHLLALAKEKAVNQSIPWLES